MHLLSLIIAFAGMLFAAGNYSLSFLICKQLWSLNPTYCHSIQAPSPTIGYWLAITNKHKKFATMLSNGEINTTFPEVRVYYTLWFLSRWATRITMLLLLALLVYSSL